MAHCFYVGSLTDFNVRKDLENCGKILSDEFDLHLLTTNPDEYEDFSNTFSIFGEGDSTFRGEIGALHHYLQKESPVSVTTISTQQDLVVPAAIMVRQHGIPHVYRYTSNDFERYKIYGGWRRPGYFILNNLIGRLPLHFSSKYIVLGSNGRRHLMDRGISVDDISILPPPFEARRFDDPPIISLPIPEKAPTVLFVGRRTWLKGYDKLEDTLPIILNNRLDLHVMIVGCGTEYPDVPGRYHDRIHPIGNVNPDYMPAYFQRADLLLVTSRGEGLPRIIVEALLAETPVLAPPIGEIPDIVASPYSNKSEMIERISNLENEVPDSVEEYTLEHLSSKYKYFYRNIGGNM